MQLNHFAVEQKLTQHCKPTILNKISLKKEKKRVPNCTLGCSMCAKSLQSYLTLFDPKD